MNEAAENQEYLKKLTVLYIEDDVDSVEQVGRFLLRCSGELFTANNGAKGMEAYHQRRPDIIITDIRMPVMDGLAMVRDIREKDSAVPIIILTAFDQAEYLKQSISIGIDDYVTKPVESARLLSALYKCTQRLRIEGELKQSLAAAEKREQALSKKTADLELVLEEKNLLEEQLKTLSMIDELTGIYNRRQCNIFLNREFIQSQRYQTDFSLLMLDLDHFKFVNDTSGHGFGDFVLKAFASRARETIRDTDEIFRYGGEEFIVLLPNTNLEAAFLLGERILEMCRTAHYDQGDHSHKVTVSIGLVSYAACRPKSPEELIEDADRLLYRAKQTGRNRLVAAPPCKDLPSTRD